MTDAHMLCEAGTLWVHKKTGNVYSIVGPCQIEATWEPGLLYVRVNNPDALPPIGPIVRSRQEFLDGRFEPLAVKL